MINRILKKNITVFGTLVFVLVGCVADLDLHPLDKISQDQVWKDINLSRSFVLGLYKGLGVGGFDEQMLASLSDEAMFTHPGRGISTINEGSLSPSSLGWVSTTYAWGSMYKYIRHCNLVIKNLSNPKVLSDDADSKASLLGEAYFLRAYYYHQLLRYYGGVPLVLKSTNLGDDFDVARNTFEECTDQIVSDCDHAAKLLGEVIQGRASKLAAMALKSRVLAYAASDLHELSKAPEVVAGSPHAALFCYNESGGQMVRWQAARKAALDVLNKGTGYKAMLADHVSTDEGKKNYISIAMGGGSAAPGLYKAASAEIIFGRYFDPAEGWPVGFVGRFNGPNGYRNWAGNTPIGLLVDDYLMDDGSQFDWSNPAHSTNPYKNRDPRFYASILYDGAKWKPRTEGNGKLDPAGEIQTGSYQLLEGDKVEMFHGLDTRKSSIEDWNGSYTGYYVRKFTDPDPNITDKVDKQHIPWPFFRYTEVIFNYVEASIELGDLANAETWLNRIRYRSGMPAISKGLGKGDMMHVYRRERRIEMAYEEQRYHDARRWLVAPRTLGRKVTYISVEGTLKPGKTMSAPYKHDDTVYNYTYTPIEVNSSENRTWLDKMYYRPLDINELRKNKKLVQNPGY